MVNKTNGTIVNQLGFKDYEEYLNSELWAGIRVRVYSRKGKHCCCCGERATLIHHRKYTRGNLSGKTLEGLYPMCLSCHKVVHFDGDRFRTGKEHSRLLMEMLSPNYTGKKSKPKKPRPTRQARTRRAERGTCEHCSREVRASRIRQGLCRRCRRQLTPKQPCPLCRKSRRLVEHNGQLICDLCRQAKVCGVQEATKQAVGAPWFVVTGPKANAPEDVVRTRMNREAYRLHIQRQQARSVEKQWDNLFR